VLEGFGVLGLEDASAVPYCRVFLVSPAVRLVETDYDVYAVDTPEDHEKVIELMETDTLIEEYTD
jgi:hypothetical protein